MNLNNQNLDQGTQEKVTNAIAQKDSHKSFKQLKDVTEELDIKHVHFGKVHITVYRGLYLSKGYQHIFAPLVDQLDQQLQQSQDAQKTPPRKQRSSPDHKKLQSKSQGKPKILSQVQPTSKSNLNTPNRLLSKTPT